MCADERTNVATEIGNVCSGTRVVFCLKAECDYRQGLVSEASRCCRLECCTYPTFFRGSIVVSIPACHAGDPGSIPGLGVLLFFLFLFLSLVLVLAVPPRLTLCSSRW